MHLASAAPAMTEALLSVENLVVSYTVASGALWRRRLNLIAVDDASLMVRHGEILALVGESGCGKTSLARAVSGLLTPSAGRVLLDGRDVTGFPAVLGARTRAAVQMVFQDPFDSLNPRKTVYATLAQPLRLHAIVPADQMRAEVARLLELVGLPASAMDLHPHEFSGGQRQRIGVARAIAPRPRLLVADEAVSALDVSIRAQLLSLLARLRRELGLAMLFITHDLTVVRSFADRVAVMYLGRLVEEGPTERVFDSPRHPYTRALLAATPIADPLRARGPGREPLGGDVPSPLAPPPGCRFHPRCPIAIERCAWIEPPRVATASGEYAVCHLAATIPVLDSNEPGRH